MSGNTVNAISNVNGTNAQITDVYSFVPATGQCATTDVTISVNVKPSITSTFASSSSVLCSGDIAPSLPSPTNTPTISGAWSPSIIVNTNATNAPVVSTYTFTASGSNCVSNGTYTVTVNPKLTPTFSAVSVCSGVAPSIPSTSTNSITGVWSPSFAAITADKQYKFTVDPNQCVTSPTVDLTVTVNANVTPTFATPAAICSGSTASLLLTSTNVPPITGTWSPAFAAILAPTDYTFTPTPGTGCFTTPKVKVTVPVTAKTTPTFSIVNWICNDKPLALPVSSSNSTPIQGAWTIGSSTVTTVNTATVGKFDYTFTPSPTACALPYFKSIEVVKCVAAGIEEAIISPFTIYPNPSNDVISVSFSELNSKNGTIKFISADGKLIESREYTNSSVETFDVKSLNPGVYFLQIDNSIEKVIVQ